jgi:rod shape-determining protein MreC
LSVAKEEQLAAEVARLQALLNLPEDPGWRYEPAAVVLRDNSAFWQQLTIRKGKNYGIEPNAPVVFSGGVVGRVRTVGLYESTVELISSPGFRLAAVLEGDQRPVSYQGGDNPTLGPSRGQAEFLPADLALSTGTHRRLMTSGLGGEFPPNLLIGELARLTPSADGMFQSGEVLLDRGLAKLSEVTVLMRRPEAAAGAAPAHPSP